MKRILLVPGDGIGREVMSEAERLLSAITHKFDEKFELTKVDWGADKWLREGVGIPRGELEAIPNKYDAILFGALGDPRIPDMSHGREILLGMRMGLDLFVNFRPVKLLDPKLSILRSNKPVDLAIFRENTEDSYFGGGGILRKGTPDEVAIDESVHTYRGVKRIMQAAFSYAQKNNKRLTMVDKSNAIRSGGALWQRVFGETKREFPSVLTDHFFVDVAAMKMVQHPEQFGVIVTSNLFGDILSDLAAALGGGLGLVASANIHPGKMGLFEPVHGSAPDIAGQGKANPFAMFLSVALMMEYFELPHICQAIETSIKGCLEAAWVTQDLGGELTTKKAADKAISLLAI